MDLFLPFYVMSGTIFAKTKGFDIHAKAGEIILLDCREPHVYGCSDAGEFLWFHFNGIAVDSYVEHLYEKSGIHYCGMRAESLRLRFREIISAAAKPVVNEPSISHNIDGILTALASMNQSFTFNELLQPALNHISNHFDEAISIEELAAERIVELCGFNSASHFARAFKKANNMTPKEFRAIGF